MKQIGFSVLFAVVVLVIGRLTSFVPLPFVVLMAVGCLLVLLFAAIYLRADPSESLDLDHLRKSESQYRNLVELSTDLIWSINREGEWTFLNQEATNEIYGRAIDEMIGRPMSDFQEAEQAKKDAILLNRVWQEGTVARFETVHLRNDGTKVWLEINAIPVRNSEGEVTQITGTATDITTRKQAEQDKEDNEQQYHGIFEASSDGFIIVNQEGRVVEVNPAACQMHGYSREEFLELSPPDFIHQESLPKFEQFRVDVSKGEPFHEEAKDIHKDGTIFDIEVHGVQFQFRGEPHILGIVRDITERKKSELELTQLNEALEERVKQRTQELQTLTERLREQAQTTQMILDHANDAFIAINAEGIIIDWNPQAEQTFGWTRLEAINQPLSDLIIPPALRGDHYQGMMHFLQTGEGPILNRRVELTALHKNGFEFPVETTISALPLGNGYRFCAFLHNISDRKQAERDLVESEALYMSLVATLPVCVLRKDREGRVVYANNMLCEMMGMELEELQGKTDFDLYPDKLASKYVADDRQVMESGRTLEDIEENLVNDEMRFVEVRKVPVVDSHKKIIGVQAIFWDVTERYNAQQEMQRAMELAESANRSKSDFLANMSHEIRTPLNAVLGITELLMGTELDSSQREYLQVVHDSGDSLLAVINDILDFSKIEAGKLELDPIPFDLRERLGDAMRSLALRAHEKKLELAFHIDPDCPLSVVGDVTRLRQILINLIGNAIKFTEQGEVVLTVTPLCETEEEVTLRFSVRDTGIGISRQKLKTIFSAFEQADTSTTRRFGGTGLGLSIAAKLVELMGGEIEARSEEGQGSTFTFTAKFGFGPEQSLSSSEVAKQLHGMRVLVVDDNETNLMILKTMLQAQNMEPTAVQSAEEAMQVLSEAIEAEDPFPLVLTDIHMPTTDGFELAQSIKEDPQMESTAILALTSGARPDDRSRCEQIGIEDYLLKPIKQSELLDAIVAIVCQNQIDEPPSKPAEESKCPLIRPLRILLAEDSLTNQKLALAILQKGNHEITVVDNGKKAVDRFLHCNFDLILMDVQMPELDGLTATREIRRLEAMNHSRQDVERIPIVAMTAHALKGDREKCLEAGMDDYIPKPVRQRELFSVLAQLFGETDQVEAASERGVKMKATLDWNEALDAVGGEVEILQDVVEAALEEAPEMLDLLQSSLESDLPTSKRAAHTLKSTMATFGAGTLMEQSLEIEIHAKNGETDKIKKMLPSYVEGVRDFIMQLQTWQDQMSSAPTEK